MKLKRKLLAGLLTLCMAVGMAVPAFAANGPSFGDYSSAYLRLGNSEDGYQTLFANSGQIDDVSGAVYDKASNTVTLTNYNNPTNILVANEMGDDLKLKLVGDNHISSLVVYGFGWGGNLEIIGDGSLTINENKTSSAAIAFMAEGTQGSLKVGSEATVTAYKMPDAPHMATYSAQFISTTSKSIPFTGNFETKLALTADSGVELEYEQTETVITEAPYESRTWQVATKGNDGRLYGVYFFEADETIGSQGQTDIADIGNVSQKGAFVHLPQIHAADGDRAGISPVPPHEDSGDGGFSAAAFKDCSIIEKNRHKEVLQLPYRRAPAKAFDH